MPKELTIEQEAKTFIYEGLRSSTLGDCYRWCRARRWMLPINDQPAGWYSAENYPWVPEILNSRATYNWVMKGAQLGLTECGINRAFYEVDHEAQDTMYVLPTGEAAKLFSKTRLKNAIRLSPYLRRRVDDSQEVKQIGTASLYIRGANGDINLKSTPVSRLVLDEIDAMAERQIWLALERLSGRRDKIVWGMSTPTFPHFGIHKLVLNSTQEHFFFECPSCGKQIELLWPDSFAIRGESLDDPDCSKSFIKCYLCHDILPHEHKTQWLKTGRWKRTAIDCDPDVRGFLLNQLYSPSESPTDIARAYHKGQGDEAARREFFNSKIGVPYVEDGAQIGDEHIDACLRDYSLQAELPRRGDPALITLGIDQGAFHHWVAVKWSFPKTLNGGNVNDVARGKVIGIGRVLQDDWDSLYQLMQLYAVKMAVIDHYPDPTHPRHFARKFGGYVYLCQYVVGRAPQEIQTKEDSFGANIVKVDKVSWLSKTFSRIMTGGIDLPRDIPFEFRRQIKGQVRTFKRGPDGNFQAEYARLHDDHWGHALNYAEIALKVLDPPMFSTDTISSIRA